MEVVRKEIIADELMGDVQEVEVHSIRDTSCKGIKEKIIINIYASFCFETASIKC